MMNAEQEHQSHRHWSQDDIPWNSLRLEAVDRQEEIFYLVTVASFVEITTDLYTRNLLEYFFDDAEITQWLGQHWEHEELQHGQCLKRYVQKAWPWFDWETSYRDFHAEYSQCCKLELLEPTRSMEMAARCVVEMGTASYYTMLSKLSNEPVLSQLTRYIRDDEVRHYKHFFHYFVRYRDQEGAGRTRILRALWHRLKMIDGEDALIALKHVFMASHPGEPFNMHIYRRLQKRCRRTAGKYLPLQMSIKMLIKPLDLNPRFQQMALPILESLARYMLA